MSQGILDDKILDIIICPKTGAQLFLDENKRFLFTKDRKNKYSIENNILMMYVECDS